MTIKDIYSKYPIPPNLQRHMFRVTSVAEIIYNSWIEKKDLKIDVILKACLVHDVGNLLKFDLINNVNFLEEEAKNVDSWRKIKSEMSEKFGPEEHKATEIICKEICLETKALWVVKNWGFGNFDKVLASNNWEYKICVYSDHRIGPFGTVKLKERFNEQRKRYEKQKHISVDINSHLSDRSEFLANCAFKVEKQIQTKINRDLDSITDQEIKTNFANYLEYQI